MTDTLLQTELFKAEKSLQFMQQEHAKTLEGLHRQISQLTQKCSGMDFFITQINNIIYVRSSILSGHAN